MKKGFSLAEVLITLMILGVIASATMPTLNNNIWVAQRGPLLKNAHERINNAFSMAMQEDFEHIPRCGWMTTENDEFQITDDCEDFGKAIISKLRVVRECQTSEEEDTSCHPKYNKLIDLTKSKYYYLQSGMSIISSGEDYFSPITFYIDTNGAKGPNKWGQDLFYYNTYYARNKKNLVLKTDGDGTLVEDHGNAKGITAQNILRNRK